jgi:hypothetical protein
MMRVKQETTICRVYAWMTLDLQVTTAHALNVTHILMTEADDTERSDNGPYRVSR